MITVFTPTYNRAHLLRRLYDSLCEQTVLKSGLSHPFEWVVVDDGSTDNTEELMQTIFAEQKISVNYIKKTACQCYRIGVNLSPTDEKSKSRWHLWLYGAS